MKLGIRGFKWVSKKVSKEALDEAVSSGDDVIMSSHREAFDLAARHSEEGRRPIGPQLSPGAGNRPHYHTNPRDGSHILFSVATGLTVSNYVSEDAPAVVKAGAAVVDLFNPLAALNDGVEIYRELAGESSPPDPGADEQGTP